MTKLSVNVNKIATLRNTRNNGIPDLVRLSSIALAEGANGITVHPRPDQRHIRFEDVAELAAVVARHPGAEYNIEGNPFHGLGEHCARVRPAQATLVPDAHEAPTSKQRLGPLGLVPDVRRALARAVEDLHAVGCRVSLFVDPVARVMPLARDLGARSRGALHRAVRDGRRGRARGGLLAALRAGGAGRARLRPRGQRRARSEPGQPTGVPACLPRRRGLDRARAHRRRARARAGGDRSPLSGRVRGWRSALAVRQRCITARTRRSRRSPRG